MPKKNDLYRCSAYKDCAYRNCNHKKPHIRRVGICTERCDIINGLTSIKTKCVKIGGIMNKKEKGAKKKKGIKYYIIYLFNNGYGAIDLIRSEAIKTSKDILSICKLIEKERKIDNVILINWKRLY